MRKADRVSAAVILALCVLFFVKARNFSPLSALFPRVIIYILASLTLLMLVGSFVRKKEGPAFDAAAFRHLPSIITGVLILAWVALTPVLGFLVTSLLVFPFMTVYLDRKAPGKKIAGRVALALGLTVGLYFFFTKILYVPFPEGLLL